MSAVKAFVNINVIRISFFLSLFLILLFSCLSGVSFRLREGKIEGGGWGRNQTVKHEVRKGKCGEWQLNSEERERECERERRGLRKRELGRENGGEIKERGKGERERESETGRWEPGERKGKGERGGGGRR